MRRNFFMFAPDGGGGNPGAGDGGQGGSGGAGSEGGGGQATDVATLAARLADLERQKSALEKDLHKERESKKSREAEAQAATAKAATTQKAVLDALKAAGIEIPGQDPAAELAAAKQTIEDEKRRRAAEAQGAELNRLKIEGALLKALAGKVQDIDYALYRAVRTDTYAAVTVEGDRVSGIEAVVESLKTAGLLAAADGDGDTSKASGKAAPSANGQPDLQGAKYPWREAKDWAAFLKLPWQTQQEAKQKDPDYVKSLEATHFRKAS